MRKRFEMLLRLALAIFLIVMSGDVFFHFFEWGAPSLDGQGVLISLTDAEYVWPLAGITMLICGLLLFFRRVVGLSLVGIAPLLLNMIIFHALYDRNLENCIPGISLVSLWVAVAITHRNCLKSLWRP